MKIVFGISRMPPKKIAKNAVSSAERASWLKVYVESFYGIGRMLSYLKV